MKPAEALQTVVFRSVAELQSIEEEWAALWSRDARATPFQSPQWLLPWAQCFAANPLIAIAVRRDEKLAALVPLYVHTDPETQERRLLLLGAGTSDYLGCTADALSADVLQEIGRVIRSERWWDIGHLSQLRSDSYLMQLANFDRLVSVAAAEPCSRILLQSGDSLPSKLRRNVGYYRRRAEPKGSLRFVQARSAIQAAEFFEALVSLHSRRWRTRGELGVLANARVLDHHRAAIPRLLASGMLRLCALQLNGKSIGVAYALADPPGKKERNFYYYLSGFDPEFHELSPGTLLLASLVDEARAEAAVAVDLLRGNEVYKQFWQAEPVATYALELTASGTAA